MTEPRPDALLDLTIGPNDLRGIDCVIDLDVASDLLARKLRKASINTWDDKCRRVDEQSDIHICATDAGLNRPTQNTVDGFVVSTR